MDQHSPPSSGAPGHSAGVASPVSPASPDRPGRERLADEQGRMLTLAHGLEAYTCLAQGKVSGSGVLVLGLGPDAGAGLASQLNGTEDVLWLECPAFVQGMEARKPGWRGAVPHHWHAVDLAQAVRAAVGRQIYWYRQNLRLFPSFWGPALGQVQAALLHGQASPAQQCSVLLPGHESTLLHRELRTAFAAKGWDVRELPPTGDAGTALHAVLREERPALCFSVNGRGLDAEGVAFSLLQACGVPVALWFVDNPWHILSAWRQPWWRGAQLFVTDASFVQPLRAAGAARVAHLPLAAAQHMWQAGAVQGSSATLEKEKPASMVGFVGRASFPDRDKFFAAASVPEDVLEKALGMLQNAEHEGYPARVGQESADGRPHFQWWAQQLSVPLWPGHAVRRAGLGAERCATAWRVCWLREALSCGLDVYGDSESWKSLLPTGAAVHFHPAVDYYNTLPAVYARTPYSLNVTSLLLPAGLTQRHFDVWAAGGFLCSDATLGLNIFPQELTREICVPGPTGLPEALRRWENSPALRRDLQKAWQALIRAAHGYTHRVNTVLEALRV